MLSLNNLTQIAFSGKLAIHPPSLDSNQNMARPDFSLKKLNEDTFARTITSFGSNNDQPAVLSQNMADYPINQFYTMLAIPEFWEGKSRYNKEINIHDNEEAFFKWFSEVKSVGVKKGSPLPKIDIGGPTGVKTIWQAMNDPARIHELIPLYIITADWYFNNENIDNPRMLDATQRLAISQLEKNLGVKIDKEFSKKDYNYEEYLKLKKNNLAG